MDSSSSGSHYDLSKGGSGYANDAADDSNRDDQLLSGDNEFDYGPELNDQSLSQLEHNDPEATCLYIHWKEGGYANSVNWAEKGKCIGDNTHLRNVTIQTSDLALSYESNGYQISGLVKQNFVAFYNGLAQNRSTRQLRIVGCGCMDIVLEVLYPMLVHTSNLSHILMDSCRMDTVTIRQLASTLSNQRDKSSLRKIELFSCGVVEQVSEELIAALHQHSNLVQLCLGGNRIGLNGCIGLGNFLQESQLKEIDLECNDINDECIGALIGPLVENKTLKKLSLSQNEGITEAGWQTFSYLLRGPNAVLDVLHLSQAGLDDEGVKIIANAMVESNSLKSLHLYFNEDITAYGWQDFFDVLKTSAGFALEEINLNENSIDDAASIAMAKSLVASNLKTLQMDENSSISAIGWKAISNLLQIHKANLEHVSLGMNNIDDEASVALSTALANSPTLKILNLDSNGSIHTDGWRAFSACFQTLRLEELDLSTNSIEDDVAEPLSNALANMSTLKKLKLNDNESLSQTGWISISTILSNPDSLLKKLDVSINMIDNAAAEAFANALTNNTSLEILDFDANRLITHVGWESFSQLLCNSSIINTFHSNHTLCQLFGGNSSEYLNNNIPIDLLKSLQLNRGHDKRAVAREKILWAHFRGDNLDVNMKKIICMGLKVIPVAIAWIGRNSKGRPLMYSLLRSMPSLVQQRQGTLGRKRHRDDISSEHCI